MELWGFVFRDVVVVQSPSCVRLFVIPWTAACQASLSLTTSQSFPNSCPLHQWWHPAISSWCPLLLLPSIFPSIRNFFPVNQLFTSGDQNTGASVSASVLPMSIQGWCPLRRSGWICLQSKGLSGVFSSSTVQGHQFFGALLLLSSSHTPCDHWEDCNLGYVDLCRQGDVCPFQHTV